MCYIYPISLSLFIILDNDSLKEFTLVLLGLLLFIFVAIFYCFRGMVDEDGII